ncbi:hypothetical protein L6164_007649 [Bauhinia variegata]|uniref:Uncharacterized protein n=1 Tax=Bauhinia variegata TaxID=167791 RepID=A0ACB9PED8_BAUVA|nr:hypothetical protein L6164_007649 [Bauhinia variegata]
MISTTCSEYSEVFQGCSNRRRKLRVLFLLFQLTVEVIQTLPIHLPPWLLCNRLETARLQEYIQLFKKRKMEYPIALATGVVAKIGESLAEPIISQVGYLIYCNKNINNLKSELKKLEGRKCGVHGMVVADRRNGRQIAPTVEDWLSKVSNIENELQGFYKDDEVNKSIKCLGGWCPNLASRYSWSKKAKKKMVDVMSLKEEKLEIISYPSPPSRLGSTFTNHIKSFQSRKLVMVEVIDELKDDEFKRIAICGMPGVGKTTFVKEMVGIIEENKLFDEVVMAVVSQNPDYGKIQGQIADALGLKFDKETVQGRACQLLDRLKHISSVLIVLDDVWMELDFESIGLPSIEHHKGCKILFTSRNEDACHKMGSQKNFTIPILSQDEAWDFFMEIAGPDDVADKPDIQHIAKEVAKECGGLPLAIVTIAKALANKERHMWEDALDQLRKSSVTSFSEMKDSVYSCIELSYNSLGNGEIKYLLLLCSFFPEDFDIPIEVLLRHMVGLGLFKGIDALWKVRNRVHTLVDKLKSHFMLLESNKEESVKMHDVVRDVMISIASREEVSWCHHSSAISSDDLECQNLKFLQVAVKKREAISKNFFQGMHELMVLGLENMTISSMPSLFQALDNLHTLRLEGCHVGETSVIGKQLRKLEILSFAHSDIKCLPIEIGQLSLLRLLDLTECNNLTQISSNALASLSRLEELYLRVRNFFTEENNSFLMGELQSLSHQLKVLETAVLGVEALPNNMVFKNIVRFWVYVEDSSALYGGLVRRGYMHPNILKLTNIYYNNIKKSETIRHLIKKAEILNLVDLKHLKNVVYELDKEGFPCLKNLSVGFCNNLEYVVDARCCSSPSSVFPLVQSLSLHSLDNLKEICYDSQVLHLAKGITWFQCFGNLRDLKIEFCTKLKSVFSLSSSASLAGLQSLLVSECYGIECIILNNMEEDDELVIEFSNLIELKLQELPSLIGFTKATVMDKSHSSKPQVQEQSYSQLVERTVVEDGQFLFGSDSESVADISNATRGVLFKSTWMWKFPNLEKIWLCECSSLDMVFDLQESKFDNQSVAVFFAPLKEIKLSGLPKLRHIWGNVRPHIQGFENLRTLKISKCDSLKYLLTSTIAKALTQLQEMAIQSCQLMEKVVGREVDENGEEEKEKIETLVFDKLDSLMLKDLPGLVGISSDSYKLVWPYLRCLCIDGCPQLKTSPNPIQIPSDQENLNEPSNSTIHDGGFCTSSDEESSRFMQRCFGCTGFHAFSNTVAEAVSTYDHLPSVNEVNTKAETQSSMPVLEQLQLKGLDSLDVIFQLEQKCHSSQTLNCLVKLMHMSRSSLRVTGFNNLTLISLDACLRLQYVFSYSIAKLLVKLQETKISNCKMVEQLVKREGEDRLIEFHESNSLKELKVSQQSHATISKETFALEWPSLKRISIVNCNILEVVIVKEEGIDMASFAQVQSLMLSHLSNLVSFCHPPGTELQEPLLEDSQGACNDAWRKMRHGPLIDGFLFPNLRYLAIVGCNRICALFSPSSSASLVCLQELEIRDCENIKEIVTKEETQPWVNKIVFHKLHHLKLERLSNLCAFCQGSYDFDFPSLQVVIFGNCHMMELFSYGSSYTPKLENVTMEIEQINKIISIGDLNAAAQLSKGILTLQTAETLRWIEQDKGLLGYFTKETDMTVQDLQRLLSLVPSNAIDIFQHLKQLTVKSCSSLLELFESGGDVQKGITKIQYELEVMNLYSLPKLRHIWNNLGGVLRFEKLRILKVEYCGSLKSTLSPTLARNLVQLQHLRVYGCQMMEEIVTKEDKGTVEDSKAKILFPMLNKLELRHLPNLKCFCPGICNFEFPSCEEIIIEKCQNMTTFSQGTVSTPKLPHIYIGPCEYVDVMGDLNMTFYYHAHSENFKMALQRSDTISWIEQDEHLLGYLKRVTELAIEGCERLLNCVPSNMIHRFQHLKLLKVRECASLVEIFESKQVDTNEGHDSKVYNYNLQEMHLYSLTKLMHLWRNLGGVILGFQNLKKLYIGRCDELKSVFSPSSARSLLQLQELSIYECEMMEEIVSIEDDRISEESNQAKIIFPALQSLTLYNLPNLKCFCSTTYNFQLPLCRDITIKECSNMETSCYGTKSTPEFFR